MMFIYKLRRLTFAALIGAVFTIGVLSAPIIFGAFTPAVAQISDDAQIALQQYGTWRPHPRFGDVWAPAGVPPDWRPYQYGHWVYTDEWGWYWVSDDIEADWGWVVFHYGRWVFEEGFGWFWVPGDEWAPAWVNWRYGDQYAGWAPLPPDELIETYEVQPAYWVFVPTRYIAAPIWRTYIVPPYRRPLILRETVIVNRTVPVHGRLAVNPGISPAYVARVRGAPVATYRVQPRVFASTQGVAGAVQVRREDLRNAGARPGVPPGAGRPGRPDAPGGPPRIGAVSVERTNTLIQPNTAAAAPQPLGKNERGRLGTNPPRAAQGTPPTVPLQQQSPPAATPPQPPPTPPANGQRPAQATPQQAPAGVPSAPATSPPVGAAPPTRTPPAQLERREGGASGGPPPQQPNIVRPTPPQAPPPAQAPAPPPQRRVQPPPPPAPPPPQQRQVQPPQPPPQQRQVQPPQAARPPGPPPGARPAGPPPGSRPPGPPPQAQKKPPPKPGEKPPEPPK
jgi:hypothetical protein